MTKFIDKKGGYEMNIIEIIRQGIENVVEEEGEWVEIRTYEEAGLLSYDEGLVVTLPDGREYQITIVQSR